LREAGSALLFVLDQATLEVMGDVGAEYAGRAGEDAEVIDRHCADCCMLGWRILGRLAQKSAEEEVIPWNEVGKNRAAMTRCARDDTKAKAGIRLKSGA
jgi:hypothetical protein